MKELGEKLAEQLPAVEDDPDMQRTLPALIRAAKRAHKIAHQHGIKVVIYEDGEVKHIPPDPAMYNDA